MKHVYIFTFVNCFLIFSVDMQNHSDIFWDSSETESTPEQPELSFHLKCVNVTF